jgi:hypothetical protein
MPAPRHTAETTTDRFEILEVDQWTSTGDLASHDWEDLRRFGVYAVHGGDSEAARAIFGGRLMFRQVTADDRPFIGHVWYRRGPDGKPVPYLAHYDSSD